MFSNINKCKRLNSNGLLVTIIFEHYKLYMEAQSSHLHPVCSLQPWLACWSLNLHGCPCPSECLACAQAKVPTGCNSHYAVISMMHHLESTYRYEVEWDDRHEDTYWDGEMTSHRHIVLSSKDDEDRIITFIFTEDKMASYCFLQTGDSKSCTLLTKERYDKAMAALEQLRPLRYCDACI